jgi:hypothetical protein
VALTLTIAGVDRTSYLSAVRIESRINNVGSMSFRLNVKDGSYMPTLFDAVSLTDGATTYFSGVLARLNPTYIIDGKGLRCECTALDHNQIAQRILRNGIEASGQTLWTILDKIVDDNLTYAGVTLHGSQATGPTMGTLTFPWMTVEEILNYLSTLTGYVWRIDYSKQLRMWAIGTQSAPTTFSRANLNIRSVQWTQDLPQYWNTVWVVYGESEVLAKSDSWAGDGNKTQFPLTYALNGGTKPSTVTRSDTGATLPVGDYGVDSMEWTYDWTNNRIVQDVGYTKIPNGHTLTAAYTAGFPQYLMYQDAGEVALRGPYVTKIDATGIKTYAEAYNLAVATVRNSMVTPKKVQLTTFSAGYDPGETVTISLSDLGLTGDFLIQAAESTFLNVQGGGRWETSLELTGGTEYAGGWLEFWQRMFDGGGGGSSGASDSVAGSSTLTGLWAYLGGSRSRSVQADAVGPPAGSPVVDYIPVTLDSARYPSGSVTVRVEVKSRAAGTAVTPKLVCLDTSAVVGFGASTASTTWEAQTFAATLVSGVKKYALYLVASNGTNEVLGIGYLE